MKILHTSDWHIGRTLYDRKRYDEFEKFFTWLLNTLESENIDVLLIAGDIFDNGTPSNKAQELYYKFLCNVNKTKCQHIVIIGGNHDSASFLNAPQSILKSLDVHVVGAISDNLEDEIIILDILKTPNIDLERITNNIPSSKISKLIICAVPYLRDKDIRTVSAGESLEDKAQNLIQGIKEHYSAVAKLALKKRDELYKESMGKKPAYIPIIGTGHLFAAGGIAGDGVRDLYVGSLAYVNIEAFPKCFDYVALGHLHIAQSLGGTEHIRYSGSPIPMGFGEAKQIKKLITVDFPENKPENHIHQEPYLAGSPVKPSINEVSIPNFQMLERISGNLDHITQKIKELKTNHSNAWLEIEYTGSEIIPDLKIRLDEAILESHLEIRRIKNKRISENIIESRFSQENLKDLNPNEVFDKCLEINKVEEADRILLKASYQEILNSILEEDIRVS
ncbi:MAG: exonuclease SbcCD subunit D C-terminal domain-containing protein [Candidatus Melainabacteria bacterium]|nr:exonuclease SbcCD subunit D C-terminal domain-containing protein [Candidatus Melainabacteria bacterium]